MLTVSYCRYNGKSVFVDVLFMWAHKIRSHMDDAFEILKSGNGVQLKHIQRDMYMKHKSAMEFTGHIDHQDLSPEPESRVTLWRFQ